MNFHQPQPDYLILSPLNPPQGDFLPPSLEGKGWGWGLYCTVTQVV